jgi:hypothetical protein
MLIHRSFSRALLLWLNQPDAVEGRRL